MREVITIDEYQDLFVQPYDRWGFKRVGKGNWVINQTQKRPYSTHHTENHVNGKYAVASIGKWYPRHLAFDIDRKDETYIDELRAKLKLTEDNHFLCTSETEGNYHIIVRPVYNNAPPTIALLDDVVQPFAENNGIEAYPQAKKPFRLPFSPIQRIVDENLYFVDSWEEKLYWFLKLDEYDLNNIPKHQQFLPLEYPTSKAYLSTYQKGQELFLHGLQGPSTRNSAQFEVLYYLWRKNVPYESAIETAYQWILRKHNDYSDDIKKKRYRAIKKEISRQAEYIYSHYDLPDETHVSYTGYITKEDILPIFMRSQGSLPKARFLFGLLKYYYPRKLKKWVPIHTDKLAEWSSYGTYQARIQYFTDREVLNRRDFYIVGQQAKPIIMNWEFKSINKAVLHDNRSPETLEQTIRECMDMEELRFILKLSGMGATHISGYLKQLYGST